MLASKMFQLKKNKKKDKNVTKRDQTSNNQCEQKIHRKLKMSNRSQIKNRSVSTNFKMFRDCAVLYIESLFLVQRMGRHD
jgi:hypothetical protein